MTVQKVNLGTLGNGKTAKIYCRYVGTRYGFRHDAVMCITGEEPIKAKCCYLNRTWEEYSYKSVLHRLAEKFVKGKTGVRTIVFSKPNRSYRLYKNLVKRIDKNRGGRCIDTVKVFQ